MKISSGIANTITSDYIIAEVMGDTYDDQGIYKEKYGRWLFRVWTQLNLSLVRRSRTVVLPIAKGTRTMWLPVDYQDIIFLGYPDGCGNWLPFNINRNLMPQVGIENTNVCDKCGNVDLCSLDMEQWEETVTIEGQNYTKTTSRIIHSDGSYTEEIIEPVAQYGHGPGDASASYITSVEMQTTRRVVCKLPNSCSGCVPASPGNLNMLTSCGCTSDICCCSNTLMPYDVKPSNTHYNLFEQEGFIQFSGGNCPDKGLLKYVSAGVCRQGVYYFPIETMETLIDGVYNLSISKKKNVPANEKDRARRVYTADRKELLRNYTRMNYQEWLEMLDQTPRLPAIGGDMPSYAQTLQAGVIFPAQPDCSKSSLSPSGDGIFTEPFNEEFV